jgi:moderate conductance mechanosensitive channel
MDVYLAPGVIKDLFFVSLTILIAYFVSWFFRSLIKIPPTLDNRRGQTFVAVLKSTISVIVYAIALHVIFGILEINIAPLLASAGIIGLSIGMGARPLIEDLIGGMTLLSQDSIAIGDDVEIDGSRGKIEKIGFRTLNIRAKDDSLHVIPNSLVKKVINYSRKPYSSRSSAKN